ncbi:hypothetical protein GX50_05210 [[Emmonsia] crescens]|uniref:Uncharacterized protein n=1 Tax=[Emmonsia] crescens TaxID=73230 RepID=A0A2B7ZDG1_9EURO|nr:hypothetical protein GX50_05210 [Emmonsia crescens]
MPSSILYLENESINMNSDDSDDSDNSDNSDNSKLSFVGLVALLATAATSTPVEASAVDVTAADWNCFQKTGGAGHAQLKKLHREFNRKFGAARLRLAAGQCYTVQCDGHYFGLCTGDVYGDLERPNHRNIAANTSPESGRQCVIYLGDDNLRYRYDNAPIQGRYKTDLRKC